MSPFRPGHLLWAVCLTLTLSMGLWLWPLGEESGHGDQGDEATRAEPAAGAVMSTTTAMISAPLGLTPAPGLGLAEVATTRVTTTSREERQLTARLRRQGVRVAGQEPLQPQKWLLDQEVFSHLSDSSTWLPELMKASSTIQNNARGEPTRLAVHDIEGDSLLWDLGLRDGDVIVLIDGEIPRFSPTNAYDLVRKAQGALAALDRGEPISLTVLRQQRPLHLFYQALNQE